MLLARAAAEGGQADLFDATTSQCTQAVETVVEQDVLFSPFTVREVRLRGLLATGRTAQAADLAAGCLPDTEPPSPHWRLIERITTAEVLARTGDEHTAATMLTSAISDAETLRLPHQVQRIIRLASEPSVLAGQTVRQQARAALARVDEQLSGTALQRGGETEPGTVGATTGDV